MSLLNFFRNIFEKDWEVDTRYEFFRRLFSEKNKQFIDYNFLLALDDRLSETGGITTKGTDQTFFSTNMVIRKRDKSELGRLRDLYSRDIKMLQEKNTGSSLDLERINSSKRRYVQLTKLLENYNYKDLSKIYLFSNNDINFIRLQFLKIPKSSGVEMAMDFIDRGITTPSRKRAFIASILYLYRHQALISYMDKTWEEYWTQNRQKALENFLHKVISK